MRASRLKHLARIPIDIVKSAIQSFHDRGQEATSSGVIKAVASQETQRRREASRNVPPLPGDPPVRIGNCREVLADIPDNSVAMILTDPPYGMASEPNYRWLGTFGFDKLIPGGSLICFTGNTTEFRDLKIFEAAGLLWHPRCSLHHKRPERFVGKYNMVFGDKPLLWFTKGPRRATMGAAHPAQIYNVLRDDGPDKSEHPWAQSEADVTRLIYDLTEPEELIVDPFAGTARWGRIALKAHRRWIGADRIKGGSTEIDADNN